MNLKIVSFNVNSIRANIRKGFWANMSQIDPDIICMQELKCQDDVMHELFGQEGVGFDLQNSHQRPQQEPNLFDQTIQEQNSIAGTGDVEDLSYQYIPYWHSCRMKKGYSGVAILIKKSILQLGPKILEVVDDFGREEFDQEGRTIVIKLEHGSKRLALVNGYYPQGGRQGRIKYKIEFYQMVYEKMQQLRREGFELVLTGDFNTTIGDIDLARPKENKKTTGCLPEERLALNWLLHHKFFEVEKLTISNPDFEWVKNLSLESLNLIDSFRYFYPDLAGQYSYWDQITRARERNVGWRIDMFLVSEGLLPNLKQAQIYNQIMGSDHCPISISLDL